MLLWPAELAFSNGSRRRRRFLFVFFIANYFVLERQRHFYPHKRLGGIPKISQGIVLCHPLAIYLYICIYFRRNIGIPVLIFFNFEPTYRYTHKGERAKIGRHCCRLDEITQSIYSLPKREFQTR